MRVPALPALALALLPLGLPACGKGADGPPNYILISIDCLRADHTTPYGYDKDTTPFLQKLADNGTVFEHNFANGNESAYSHAAMLTGRYASELAQPVYLEYAVPDDAIMVGDVLRLYGYETAAFIAGGHVGEEFGFNQGWDTFHSEEGFASFWHTTPRALEWVEERQGDQPWFVFLHGYDVHRPYVSPGPYYHQFNQGYSTKEAETVVRHGQESEKIFDGVYYPDMDLTYTPHTSGVTILDTANYDRLALLGPVMGRGIRLSPDEIAHIRGHYDAVAYYADVQLALFLSALERDGLLENTVVIVTADHGEDLLDHGFVNHRTTLADSSIGVPLIVAGPGVPKGARIKGLVDALDIVPTVLKGAGAQLPAGVRDRSLVNLAQGQTDKPLEVTFAEGVRKMVSARTLTHKLVYKGQELAADGYAQRLQDAQLNPFSFELYDLVADPGESRNTLESPTEADLAVAEDLRARMVAWRQSIVRGTHRIDAADVDPGVLQELRDKGYWEFGSVGAEGGGPPSGEPSGGVGAGGDSPSVGAPAGASPGG